MKCTGVISPLAALILFWNCLFLCHILFLCYFVATTTQEFLTLEVELKKKANNIGIEYGLDTLYCVFFFSFPIVGLLTDVWVGRYKAIRIGMIFCFLAFVLSGIGFIFGIFTKKLRFLWMLTYSINYILEIIGFACFKANIVQYNIDQLIGASADELNTVIYWHYAFLPMGFTVFELTRCLLDYEYFILLSIIISGVTVSIVLVTHSLFKHKLENISLINNPLKLIARVLNYARKHKYPENRSALTYWEEEAPSRLDLGKEKYGGPFTEEEVEDVKTIFRMLPLLIVAVVGYASTDEVYHLIMEGKADVSSDSFVSCLVSVDFMKFLTASVIFVIYLLVVRICLQKYIPKLLMRMFSGLVFAFLSVLIKGILLYFSPELNNTLFIPSQAMEGITFAIVFPSSLEFTIAQAPVHTRGVMVGVWMASMGLGFFINIFLKPLFGCHNENFCTSSYYYFTKSGLVLIILIVFVILAKRYKFRVRENEVNIHQIVDDHYQRYMEQDQLLDYDNDLSLSTD